MLPLEWDTSLNVLISFALLFCLIHTLFIFNSNILSQIVRFVNLYSVMIVYKCTIRSNGQCGVLSDVYLMPA